MDVSLAVIELAKEVYTKNVQENLVIKHISNGNTYFLKLIIRNHFHLRLFHKLKTLSLNYCMQLVSFYNLWKPLVFFCFQGLKKETGGMKQINNRGPCK